MVVARGKGGCREVEEGKGEINGDGRKINLGWGTQSIQIIYCRIAHLKPI